MAEMFHEGGWGMFPTAIFGALMVIASLAYAIKPEKRFVPLQISLGILTLSAGSLGFITGMIKSFGGLHQVEESKRWIWMLGMGESLNNVALAFICVVLAVLVASVGALRIALRPAEVR